MVEHSYLSTNGTLVTKYRLPARADRQGVFALLWVLVGVGACATGVDVSQVELAEICSTPGVICDDSPSGGASGAGPVGSSGSSAGTNPLGSSGSGGSFGASGSSSVGGSAPSGGSGGTSTGTAGAGQVSPGGSCSAAAAAPTAVGGCATGGTISVSYRDRSDAAEFNQMTMVLNVENSGTDFSLANLVLRYWFSPDGETAFTSAVDYAQVGKENVCVSFGNQRGQSFADIGFTSNAMAGGSVRDVQVRLFTQNYAPLSQADDFSYIGGANNVANQNITVYLAGTRVAGCEP